MSRDSLEKEILEKGLNADRVTPEDVGSAISSEYYFTAEDGVKGAIGDLSASTDPAKNLKQVTFCILVLKNGHRIIGINTGSISPENFDAELARKLAREDAINQIWALLGFLLREKKYIQTPKYNGAM